MIGEVFGRLTVTGEASRSKAGRKRWLCRCACGKEVVVSRSNLTTNHTRSCGCLGAECAARRRTTHGMTSSPEHKTWRSMRKRCSNPNDTCFDDYGGRGIKVCERWAAFENFLADMGKKPSSKHSLDRLDNNGNYEPGNCRWATVVQQARNRRSTVLIMHKGEAKTLPDWAEQLGISYNTLKKRRIEGMTGDKLFRPTRR